MNKISFIKMIYVIEKKTQLFSTNKIHLLLLTNCHTPRREEYQYFYCPSIVVVEDEPMLPKIPVPLILVECHFLPLLFSLFPKKKYYYYIIYFNYSIILFFIFWFFLFFFFDYSKRNFFFFLCINYIIINYNIIIIIKELITKI